MIETLVHVTLYVLFEVGFLVGLWLMWEWAMDGSYPNAYSEVPLAIPFYALVPLAGSLAFPLLLVMAVVPLGALVAEIVVILLMQIPAFRRMVEAQAKARIQRLYPPKVKLLSDIDEARSAALWLAGLADDGKRPAR